jgi:predicted oxidoreductase
MHKQRLSSGRLEVSRIAYGCMPLGGSWEEGPPKDESVAVAKRALRAALDAGMNCFDHADIYCRGKSELVFARAFAELGVQRQSVVLQSKCGIRLTGDPAPGAPHRFDFSREHIVGSTERILRRLETDYLDLLLLHRPDALVEPEEVAAAFDELERSGKVLNFGVSNHTAGQIELLKKYVRQPIVANQVELSLVHTPLLDAGITANQSHASRGADGTLDYCRLHGITLQAWAPLARGRALGGDEDESARELSRVVARFAEQKGVPKEAIPIAFLLRHPARIQVVIGTTQPMRIAASARACDVELSREEWYELYVAGRGSSLP